MVVNFTSLNCENFAVWRPKQPILFLAVFCVARWLHNRGCWGGRKILCHVQSQLGREDSGPSCLCELISAKTPLRLSEEKDRSPSLSSQHPFIVPWDSDGCQALSVSALGQAVVARRGNCTFYTKALNAQLADASSLVIIYNETDLVRKTYMHKRMSNTHTYMHKLSRNLAGRSVTAEHKKM